MSGMFVDASALTSIIVGEDDADLLAGRLELATSKISSPIAVWETAVAVARIKKVPAAAGESEVNRFLRALGIVVLPVEADAVAEAINAYERYGKGAGHPARLNMGDCFAYACARTNQASLLYKGDDFLQTDLGR